MAEDAPELNRADLAWARALAAGDAAALERYEGEVVPMINAQLRRRDYSVDEITEVQQELRARLLVGHDGNAAITGYQGRGRLVSWVLVAALRQAVRERQRRRRDQPFDDEALLALAEPGRPAPDPDKRRYRASFAAAFRAALAALQPRDRNLLRMHLLDALSIDEIGALLGVHRATAARWLAAAREAVSRGVRLELIRELGVDRWEAESLMHWIRSRVELSLGGFGETDPG